MLEPLSSGDKACIIAGWLAARLDFLDRASKKLVHGATEFAIRHVLTAGLQVLAHLT